ncbi:MAG: hypothetical protein Q7K44_05245 [Candidatus Liptonbacteria bacterium]|nr:hypothetical protein [Candidatus Liptonbacteria bacterium]
MPQANIKDYEIYFDDPRLLMSLPGRLFVRVASYIGYLLLIAADVTFLLSDLKWLKAVGGFFVVFLVDQVVHLGVADVPISEMP